MTPPGSTVGTRIGKPTLAEQAHNRDHKSTDPCGQTKKQHNVVAEEKRHPRPLRMGGANIAPDVTDGVFPCEVGAAPEVGTVHRRWLMKG